ncbi:MAG: hypothetical protein H6618_05110 [Deltaproteobacteria bacterium]|nr:hypothetical protein [Deltaproteobacteria bacterium]
MMKQKVLVAMLIALAGLSSCQTPPEGSPQLSAGLEEYKDKEGRQDYGSTDIGKGRPVHIRGWSYGRITPGGDIWLGGPVYFYLGRENLDYHQILQKNFLRNDHEKDIKTGTEDQKAGSENS